MRPPALRFRPTCSTHSSILCVTRCGKCRWTRSSSKPTQESLAAQPASTDPRELSKAEERIKDLQKENALLKININQSKTNTSPIIDSRTLQARSRRWPTPTANWPTKPRKPTLWRRKRRPFSRSLMAWLPQPGMPRHLIRPKRRWNKPTASFPNKKNSRPRRPRSATGCRRA